MPAAAWPALAVLAAAAAVETAATIYNGEQQRKAQNTAQDFAVESAKRQEAQAVKAEKAADEANNRAMRKTPNTASIMSAAEQAAKGGVGGTMLTGPTGVDPNALKLGKTSLLGG